MDSSVVREWKIMASNVFLYTCTAIVLAIFIAYLVFLFIILWRTK